MRLIVGQFRTAGLALACRPLDADSGEDLSGERIGALGGLAVGAEPDEGHLGMRGVLTPARSGRLSGEPGQQVRRGGGPVKGRRPTGTARSSWPQDRRWGRSSTLVPENAAAHHGGGRGGQHDIGVGGGDRG